jgi:hypothetical protein
MRWVNKYETDEQKKNRKDIEKLDRRGMRNKHE